VILDVDGTLVDSNDAHAHAWVAAFASAGITVAFDRVRRAIGMGGDKLMPAVSGLAEDSPVGKQIAAQRGEIFRDQFLPRLRPFPGTRALVERFAADGFTLAIASSAKEDELQPLLDRTKSDPRQTVMIGDTPYDVEAALRAGIRVVGVECGGWQSEDLQGAVEVYDGPEDLLKHYDASVFARLGSR
jgi:phosphoglycolate phosphatase-like HAD superfamily hydrolase